MGILYRISEKSDKFFRFLVTVFFIAMFVLYFGQVVLRYFFHTGLPWAEELVRYLMIAMTYIGAAVLTKEGSQISMTLIEDIFPYTKKWLHLIQYIFTIIFYVIITYLAILALNLAQTQKSPAMGLPMSVIYAVIPLSTIFMVIHLIIKIYDSIKGGER
ncbi:MAG: TRAP transporter small permease [Tepidanaerobacteraceae bacterium]|jgi:C4-dicarboxylate transporter DctQ subunit|nr:TRAP transporter small permease [Tepidanaerobacteraceae bacterium]